MLTHALDGCFEMCSQLTKDLRSGMCPGLFIEWDVVRFVVTQYSEDDVGQLPHNVTNRIHIGFAFGPFLLEVFP